MDERREKARLIFTSFALGILAGVSIIACANVENEGTKSLLAMFAIMSGTGSAFAGAWAWLITPRNQS